MDVLDETCDDPDTCCGIVCERYRLYALWHRECPCVRLANDQEEYPGGPMAPYLIWVRKRLREWCAATGHPERVPLSDAQQREVDRWIYETHCRRPDF